MKLYNLPQESYFTADHDEYKEVFFFKHIDGMYSYCLDKEGKVIHFDASMEVTKHE